MVTLYQLTLPEFEAEPAIETNSRAWEDLLKEARSHLKYLRLVGADIERRRHKCRVVYGLDRDVIYAFQYPQQARWCDPVLTQDTLRLSKLPITILPGAFIELWRSIAQLCSELSMGVRHKQLAMDFLNLEPEQVTSSSVIPRLVEQMDIEQFFSALPANKLLRISPSLERVGEILTRPGYVHLGALIPKDSLQDSIDEELFKEIAIELARFSKRRSERTRNNAADALSWIVMLAINDAQERLSPVTSRKYYLCVLTKTAAFDSVDTTYGWTNDPLMDLYEKGPISLLRSPAHMTHLDQVTQYGTANTVTSASRYSMLKDAYCQIESIILNDILGVDKFVDKGDKARTAEESFSLRQRLLRDNTKVTEALKDALSNPLVMEIQHKFQMNEIALVKPSTCPSGQAGVAEDIPTDLVRIRADAAMYLTLLAEEYLSSVDTIVEAASRKKRPYEFWVATPVEQILDVQQSLEDLPYGKRMLLSHGSTKGESVAAFAADYHFTGGGLVCFWSCLSTLKRFVDVVQERSGVVMKWELEGGSWVGEAPGGSFSLETESEIGWAPRASAVIGDMDLKIVASVASRTMPISIPSVVIERSLSEFVKTCRKEGI